MSTTAIKVADFHRSQYPPDVVVSLLAAAVLHRFTVAAKCFSLILVPLINVIALILLLAPQLGCDLPPLSFLKTLGAILLLIYHLAALGIFSLHFIPRHAWPWPIGFLLQRLFCRRRVKVQSKRRVRQLVNALAGYQLAQEHVETDLRRQGYFKITVEGLSRPVAVSVTSTTTMRDVGIALSHPDVALLPTNFIDQVSVWTKNLSWLPIRFRWLDMMCEHGMLELSRVSICVSLWQQGLDSFGFPPRQYGRRDWREGLTL